MNPDPERRREERRAALLHLADETGFGQRRLRRRCRIDHGVELKQASLAVLATLSVLVKERTRSATHSRLTRPISPG